MTVGALFTIVATLIVISIMLGGLISFAIDCIKGE